MREMDDAFLEEYLDGELTGEEIRLVEQRIATDAAWAARLANLRRLRTLRQAVYKTYRPSEAQAAALARVTLEQSYARQYAPLATIGAPQLWLKRATMIAACLLISVGSFLVGNRMRNAAPAAQTIGYTVNIQLPDGQKLTQTFASYQQAERFVQTYQADSGSVTVSPPPVQASAGVF